MLYKTIRTWLPLALSVLGAYAFQRGLVMFSKLPQAPSTLLFGLKIYFMSVALSALFIGILCDQVSTRKLLLVFTLLGWIGIMLLPYTAWGFGLLFGASAAMVKIGPFSGPLKLLKDRLSWGILPQSIGKSAGPAIFAIFLGSLLLKLSWSWAVGILAGFYVFAGLLGYFIMPDDKIVGWKLGEIKLWIKSWKVWLFMGHQSTITIIHQLYLASIIPALLVSGYSMTTALILVGLVVGLYEILVRIIAGWTGDRVGYWPWMVAYPICGIIGLPLLSNYPVVGMLIISAAGAAQTNNYCPMAKKIVGPVYLGTFLGIGLVVQYFCASLLF